MKKTMDSFLGCRIDVEDYKNLSEAASNQEISVSELVRILVYKFLNNPENLSSDIYKMKEKRKIVRDERTLLIRKLVDEINKIGVNVNQIAARVNSGVTLKVDAEELIARMEQIYLLLADFK